MRVITGIPISYEQPCLYHLIDIHLLVSDNKQMDKRKRFQRICKSCGQIDIVRSDQLNCKCKPCQMILGGLLLGSYVKANPESCSKGSRKHGMHNTRLYRIHKSMMERCGHTGTRHKWAMYYEDRGIKVCEYWHDRTNFFTWALANGYAENLEIDRIDNNNGYNPDNCRWVTHLVNMRNRRKSTTTPTFSGCFPSFSSPLF